MKKICYFLLLIFLGLFSIININCNKKIEKEYVVNFIDWDGIILKKYIAKENEAAIPPIDPTREGYEFTGWDIDFSCITNDLVVQATYVIKETIFTVRFYSENEMIKSEKVNLNSTATPPENPKKDGYTFVGWDADFSNITCDLNVNAIFKEGFINTFNVNFYDYDGNKIITKVVEENKNCEPVILNEINNMHFIGWNVSLNNVNKDLHVFPLYIHQELDLNTEITATIKFNNENILIDGTGIERNGSNITIINAGTYLLSGTCLDGSITIIKNSGNVNLLLNNLNLSSSTSPLQIKGGSNFVTITALKDTINTFTDSNRNGESPKSCINATKDVVINGSGKIIVNGNNKNGIKSDSSLYIENVELVVNSIDNGIAADNLIKFVNSIITINSKSDCIKSNPESITETTNSNIYVYNGLFNLVAIDDGFQSLGNIYIFGGNFIFNIEGKKFNQKKEIYKYNYD